MEHHEVVDPDQLKVPRDCSISERGEMCPLVKFGPNKVDAGTNEGATTVRCLILLGLKVHLDFQLGRSVAPSPHVTVVDCTVNKRPPWTARYFAVSRS